MTTENEPTNYTEKSIEPGDLGKLLEEYRDIAHLDVNQIADTLCLTQTAINLLESENFDKLPEPPYVRGYLRNYARLADQDPAQVIHLYNVLRGASIEDDRTISIAASNSYHEVAKPLITPQRFRLALLAGLLLILGVLTMIPGVRDWTGSLWSNFSGSPESSEKVAELDSKTQHSLNLPSLTDDIPGNLPISPDETGDTIDNNKDTNTESSGTTEPPAREESAEELTSKQPTDNPSSKDSLLDETTQPTDEDNTETNENTSASDSDADADADNSGQEPIAEGEGNTNLKFVFAQEVWLRINGKDGSIVYEALHPAGTEKTLTLDSPLKFKVGNAPAMQLFVNGTEMDTSEYTKGSVARFGIE